MITVRYTLERVPPVNKKDLDRVDAINDDAFDYSEIPEIIDLFGFRPHPNRKLDKPKKVAVICNLDPDIVAWLKQSGKSYHTRVNSILRKAMVNDG